MEENKLNAFNIYSIAETLNKKLNELDVRKSCTLSFIVDDKELRKIDEDLFYRMNKDNGEFTPSDSVINIKYGNVNVVIEKKEIN